MSERSNENIWAKKQMYSSQQFIHKEEFNIPPIRAQTKIYHPAKNLFTGTETKFKRDQSYHEIIKDSSFTKLDKVETTQQPRYIEKRAETLKVMDNTYKTQEEAMAALLNESLDEGEPERNIEPDPEDIDQDDE